MAITLIEASEIVSGLTITGKVSPSAIRIETLFPPYNDLVKHYREGVVESEELIERVGLNTVQAALESIKNLDGLSSADWLSILENTFMKYNMGVRMEKLGKKLQRGEDVDAVEIRHLANQFGKGKTGRFTLNESNIEEVPFIETGLSYYDKHLGGIPEVGLIVIAGDSGVGKTTFMRDFSKAFIQKYKNKRATIYSLEMFKEEIIGKYNESGKLTDDEISRLEINCDPMSIHDIIADASNVDNLGLIMVDFVDMLISGEATTGKYSEIYLACHYGAKQLHVPIVLFAQFVKSYQGGIPRPYHIAWTNMSKILAWQQLMLYRPAEDFYAEKDRDILPIISDIGYLIAWKIRGGFRKHLNDSPGAIQLPFDGKLGWGVLPDGKTTSGKWFSLKNI
jgi:hypothetical protein